MQRVKLEKSDNQTGNHAGSLQAEKTGVSIKAASSRRSKEYHVPVILFDSSMRTTGNMGL